MAPAQRRLRRVSAIFACAALVVSSNSFAAPSHAQTATDSATARAVTVPIRTSQIRMDFDSGQANPKATLHYTRTTVPVNELLSLKSEVFPIVAHITGCTVLAIAAENQLMPDMGVTTIPLSC